MRRSINALLMSVVLATACNDAVAPQPIPEAPANLSAALRPTEIQLNWRDESTNEDSFRVEVSIDEGPWLPMAPVPKDQVSVTFPDPQPVTSYQFRIAACNSGGCSEFREVSVSTAVWSRPELVIQQPEVIGSTSVSVRVSVSSDFPVDLLVVVRTTAGESFAKDEHVSTNLHPNFFFHGLTPGATYMIDASVQGKFGIARAEPRTFTLPVASTPD